MPEESEFNRNLNFLLVIEILSWVVFLIAFYLFPASIIGVNPWILIAYLTCHSTWALNFPVFACIMLFITKDIMKENWHKYKSLVEAIAIIIAFIPPAIILDEAFMPVLSDFLGSGSSAIVSFLFACIYTCIYSIFIMAYFINKIIESKWTYFSFEKNRARSN